MKRLGFAIKRLAQDKSVFLHEIVINIKVEN